MKAFKRIAGIIAIATIIGFVFLSCDEDKGISVDIPSVGSLPSAPLTVQSIENGGDAEELLVSLSGEFESFSEAFMYWFNNNYEKALEELLGGEPNYSINSARTINVNASENNGDMKVTVKIDNEKVTEGTIVNGYLSANVKMNENSMAASGNAKVTIEVAEKCFGGVGSVAANVNYSMGSNNKITVNTSFAAAMGLTIWNDTKGMKVIADVSASINETFDSAEDQPSEEQTERMMKALKGSLTVYDLDGKFINKISIDDIINGAIDYE